LEHLTSGETVEKNDFNLKIKDVEQQMGRLQQHSVENSLQPDEVKSFPVYKGKGCPICNNTGYKGRLGLYEVMPMKEEVKELILSRSSASEIRKEAIRLRMKTLRQSGIFKIKEGMTTIEEVVRKTMEDR
jgi:type IV pilus assembly protein PilB